LTYVADEYGDVQRRGVELFVFPCGVNGTTVSIANTAALFYGSNVSRVQQSNIDFLVYRGLFDKFEPFGKVEELDTKLIKSGDNMQVLKLDGLDPLIAWGTGGRTGHTTLLVWEDIDLFVCESTDASPFGSYWPPPYGKTLDILSTILVDLVLDLGTLYTTVLHVCLHVSMYVLTAMHDTFISRPWFCTGIIRTPYKQWIEQAKKAGFSVVLLPLSDAGTASCSLV
jgi:hypothetical protein